MAVVVGDLAPVEDLLERLLDPDVEISRAVGGRSAAQPELHLPAAVGRGQQGGLQVERPRGAQVRGEDPVGRDRAGGDDLAGEYRGVRQAQVLAVTRAQLVVLQPADLGAYRQE